MTQAVIYARFSTAEQSKGYSLERQQQLGAEFAAERGWHVEKTLSDEGRSAFHGRNRLEGSELHQFELEAKNGLHDDKVLVVENIDRLSRQGAKAAAQLIWALNENGVSVATYQDGHVYKARADGDMLDVFKLIVIAQQGHEESKNKSKRTSSTWKKRFKAIAEGTQVGPVPHTPPWIDRTPNGLELNEYRTALLNELFDLYVDGIGIHRIVTLLNERGEPSWTPAAHERHVNGWFYSYIFRLLTKRAVLGEYVTRDGKTLSTSFFPQAISAAKWNAAQSALALRAGNQTRSRGNTNRNLLQQIVLCAECGGGAFFEHTTDATQKYRKANGEIAVYRRKTYRRLRCDRARRRHQCDNQTVLNYDIVEGTILEELLPRLIDKRPETDRTAELRERLAQMLRIKEADQQRLENLLDALADGGARSIIERVAKLEAQIDKQTGDIEEAQRLLAVEAAKPSNEDDALLIGSLRAKLASEDEEERIHTRGRVNLALRRLIKRVQIRVDGTFLIQPDEHSWWLFDETGKMLEGAYALSGR